MSVNATIGNRIADLIGDTYSTIPSNSYKDLINAAFNECADAIKPELLLKYSRTPGALTEASTWLVEDRKILKVTRVDANSNGVERECKLLSVTEFSQAKDSASINYATAYSPVYTFDDNNDGAASLSIFPVCNNSGQTGKIWYFAYALATTDLTGVNTTTLNTQYYMPSEIIHAIVLKSCINILQAYMSNQVQDEEDSEIVQLLQAQLAGLQQDYQQEISRFMSDQDGSAE
jgi:hypothetical protein